MIHVLAEGTDEKGIALMITHNDNTKEWTVLVYAKAGKVVKSISFAANRWGYALSDNVRALGHAEVMAAEIEKGFADDESQMGLGL